MIHLLAHALALHGCVGWVGCAGRAGRSGLGVEETPCFVRPQGSEDLLTYYSWYF